MLLIYLFLLSSIGVDRFAFCPVHSPLQSFEQDKRFISCLLLEIGLPIRSKTFSLSFTSGGPLRFGVIIILLWLVPLNQQVSTSSGSWALYRVNIVKKKIVNFEGQFHFKVDIFSGDVEPQPLKESGRVCLQ